MKIKKYIATTMHEAMQKIRAELGDEAVILNSKEIETGGFLGFFTKKKLEVIVAIDEVKQKPVTKQKLTPIQNDRKEQQDESLMTEIHKLKKMIEKVDEKIIKQDQDMEDLSPAMARINQYLQTQFISEKTKTALLEHLQQFELEQTECSEEELKQELINHVRSTLSKLRFGGINYEKKIVAIVGPTGVGKTTTIAKIAANSTLKEKKKVAFITTDTYRIAAVEQLKTYAKILNIPIEVAYTAEDFRAAIATFSDYDLIIVDSAGRNFRNEEYVNDLQDLLQNEEQVEIFLALSLTAKYEDMVEIVDSFRRLRIDQLIFTKEDETSSYSALLNIPFEFEKGIAYLTNGQNVPDDLVVANVEQMIERIFGELSDA